MGTQTVNTRTTAVTGKGTLVTHSPVITSPVGGYSLHDCADPRFVELYNCIYPINFASPDGKTFTNGLTVHSREPGGSVSVTTA